MSGLLKRRHKETGAEAGPGTGAAADRDREQQEQEAKAKNDREQARGEVYKPPPEQNVLGWGHRGE
ncbi:hypothetical protein GCM10010218_17780 [Streptomyces mashuensis]|uniref:Uncharacterized protein n=1 Tax=Streptomyces mashuensis TaxID=33904 RepID=A0A919EC03_9ACTN|nr:hypothetical protein [Streptomyces mashuensis]GHF36684.1 hypothetical protein GCM10010218_17780 [Streptomyces mashuensis]